MVYFLKKCLNVFGDDRSSWYGESNLCHDNESCNKLALNNNKMLLFHISFQWRSQGHRGLKDFCKIVQVQNILDHEMCIWNQI